MYAKITAHGYYDEFAPKLEHPEKDQDHDHERNLKDYKDRVERAAQKQ